MAGSWVEGTRSWCFVCRAVRPNCAVCEVCGVAPELFSVLADEVGPDAEMLAEYREGFGMFAGDDGTLDRAKLGTMFRSLGQDYDGRRENGRTALRPRSRKASRWSSPGAVRGSKFLHSQPLVGGRGGGYNNTHTSFWRAAPKNASITPTPMARAPCKGTRKPPAPRA